jgi:cyclophilin family peptidyl-prolyl cis-trans isomerase/HEAT repeat protein
MTSAVSSRPSLIRFVCSLALAAATLAVPGTAPGQDPAVVEALAFLLQAEDSRRYDAGAITSAARHAEPLVRRAAALAIGRIGDPEGSSLLEELLQDPDSTVQRDAAFAVGLMRDTTHLAYLRDLVVNTPQDRQHELHAEAAVALTRMATPAAADVIRALLGPWVARASTAAPPLAVEAAIENSWRLGPLAPVNQLIEFASAPVHRIQLGAVFSLSRLRAPQAAEVLLSATDHPEIDLRLHAVRALTASYADSAGLDRLALASRVRRLVGDDDPHVRAVALRSLGTYRDSTLAPAAKDRLADSDPNVRVQAVATLGDLGGAEAETALRGQVRRQPFAVRRNAVIGLARVAGVRSLDVVSEWLQSTDWLSRMVAAEALGHITADTVISWLVYFATQDPDPRVAAVALASLSAVGPDTATVWARQLITHRDAVVRANAADRLGAAADPGDIKRLVQGYRLAERDSISDARIAIVGALGRIAERGFAERVAVEDEFLTQFPTCRDYVVRRAAATLFPEAARRWGPERPIETGRGIEDYRDIARRFVAPGATGTQTLVLDTDRGRIVVDLFAREAPLTVTALLQLVDQRAFDNILWHRVVPAFVAQTGDPRGDGNGGPGVTLRDEINRLRYFRGNVGMALSGPDTGGSQFFITLSPQPHLDGTYPVIGRVLSGMEVVDLITQGDRIRTVRRQ